MLKKVIASFIDILIVFCSAYLFYKYFPYNKELIQTKFYHTDLKANLFSIFLIIYFGLIPYFRKGQTLGDIIMKVNRFREIKDEETKFLGDTPNPVIKLAKYFFYRISIFLLDISLLNVFIFLFKKTKNMFKKKSTN